MDAVLKARNQIADILTLKCPWCSAAWLDFSACCHVTCLKPTCGRPFCACCLATEGHTPGCLELRDGYQLKAAHAELRKTRLFEYLRTLSSAVRIKAVQACAKDLSDLGLNAHEFM